MVRSPIIVPHRNSGNPEVPKVFYAQAKDYGQLTLRKLSKEIAESSSTVSDMDVLVVLNNLTKILKLNFEKSLGSQWSIQIKELDELLAVDYSTFHVKEQASLQRLMKNRDIILTFLYHPEIPPDNNASERTIRNVKVKTKVSGQFRNKEGKEADRFARIRSVINTTIKNRQEVLSRFIKLGKGVSF